MLVSYNPSIVQNLLLYGCVHFSVNPLHTGGLFHCYMLDESICHFRGVGSIFVAFILFLMENFVSKQYRH